MIDTRNSAVSKAETMSTFTTLLGSRDSKKFHFSWTGPFQVTAKLSDLNYELLGHNDRKFIVNINRLKPCNRAANRKSNPRLK